MSRKTFLTSSIILGLAISPAVAVDDVYTTDIADSCTVDVLGSVEGNAASSFLAQYAPIKYTSAAGTYLLFSNGEISENQTCPTGSYCPGFTNVDFNDATMGLNSCPSAYSLSAAGAKTEAECYRQCTAGDVAHSKSTGTFTGMFYSNETNACEPVNDASCADGYHYKAGSAGLNVDASIGGDSHNGDLSTTIWNTTFSYGNITGKARCSTKPGDNQDYTWTNPTTFDTLADETGTGRYCYCQIDGYTPVGGSKQSLSGAWVFLDYFSFVGDCAARCATYCANGLHTQAGLRVALFGSVPASPAICEANTITVTWNPANGNDPTTNTCTYDGDITLPTAPTKTGYTFSGWKLVTGSSSN